MKTAWFWVAVLGGLGLFAFVVYKMLPRGIRNNNPGNLRPLPGGQKWLGELEPDQGPMGKYSRFEFPWQGWRAMAIDVYGDIARDGLDTIQKLVTEYAPAADKNNETEYVGVLVDALKISKDLRLNVYLHGPTLLRAIAKHELGINPDLTWGAAERERGIQAGLEYLQAKGVV